MRTFQPKAEEKVALDLTGLPTDKPIGLYYRQSSQAQVGNVATDMQRVDLKEDLKRLGYSEDKIILVDMDEGVSGTLPIDKREGMRFLYELVAERQIGAVACFDEDRLFRDATGIEYHKFIEHCRRNKVVVWTPDTTYVFHHPTMGKMWIKMFRQKCEMAAEALELIKKRLGGAKQRLMREGKHAGQPLPIGYMADVRADKKSPEYAQIVPFPEYAILARRIFEVFVDANGNPRETYRRLLAEGFRIPPLTECSPPMGYRTNYRDVAVSGVPTIKTIRKIVTNPFYIGHFMQMEKNEDGEEVVAFVRWNNHEAIIPEDLFFRAFNYLSKFDLYGNPNPHYAGVGRTRILKTMPPRTAERPLCEGKVFVYLDEEWQRAGTWYQADAERYNYACGRKKQQPNAASWQRAANWLDEAVIYHLRERLLSTLELDEIEKTLKSKEAAQAAERQHIERQIKDAAQQLKLREKKYAATKNLNLLASLEREYTAIEADYKRLLERREQLSEQPSDNLEDMLNHLHALNKPETMLYADLRRYVIAFVNRITVVTEGQHKGDSISIEWIDGKTTDFQLHHQPGERGWSFAEIEAIRRGIAEGWTQIEFAASCPTRTWNEISKVLSRKFGTSAKVPRTRNGAWFYIPDLERGDVTEAEVHKLSKVDPEGAKELRGLRRKLKIKHDETFHNYCLRVLGVTFPTGEVAMLEMLLQEDFMRRGLTKLLATDETTRSEITPSKAVSDTSSSAHHSPCRE